MSMETVSGDIFSILRRFTSPTMGQFSNSNAPRPMPPKAAANTDAARLQSDPTRYGATGSDAGAGLVPQPPTGPAPPQPPQPTASRVVPGRPPAAAPPPAARPPVAAAPDVEATGAVAPPPPTDGSRATALVNAPDGAPASPAAVGGEFDFITQNPLYKFMKIEQAKKKAEADRQRNLDNVFFGLSKAVGGFTGTPVETGQPGARGGNPSGDPTLTFENLKDLQGQAAAAQKDAAMRQVADQIARENPGMSRAAIEAAILAHPEKFGDLGFNLADPKNRADVAKTIADTIKVGVDTDKAKQDLAGANVDDPAVIEELAKQFHTTPDHIRSLSITQRQELAAKGLTAKEAVLAQNAPEKLITEHLVKSATEKVEKASVADRGIQANIRGLNMVNDDSTWVGAFWGQEPIQKAVSWVGDALGWGNIQVQGITNAQQLQSAAGEALLARAKELGSQPTDSDREVIRRLVGGDGSINRDALRELYQVNLRMQLRAQLDSKKELDKAKSVFLADPSANPTTRRWLESTNIEPMNLTAEAFPPDRVAKLRAVAASAHTDADKARDREDFDKNYGRGMADYILGFPQ
jgi:hypothetical protein